MSYMRDITPSLAHGTQLNVSEVGLGLLGNLRGYLEALLKLHVLDHSRHPLTSRLDEFLRDRVVAPRARPLRARSRSLASVPCTQVLDL
jgi:hypothetical protein